jgi:hypothetical protein
VDLEELQVVFDQLTDVNIKVICGVATCGGSKRSVQTCVFVSSHMQIQLCAHAHLMALLDG